MASEMRYVDGIPVVPKHTAMIDFLELCQSGATLKSVTLDSEMRKSSVDGSWALIETEESGLSSRAMVEKIREAIIENEEGDPDFVWAIVEPADAVAIKKEMIDAGDAWDEEDEPAGMVLAKFEERDGELFEVETFDGGKSSKEQGSSSSSSELAYKLHLHLRLPFLSVEEEEVYEEVDYEDGDDEEDEKEAVDAPGEEGEEEEEKEEEEQHWRRRSRSKLSTGDVAACSR